MIINIDGGHLDNHLRPFLNPNLEKTIIRGILKQAQMRRTDRLKEPFIVCPLVEEGLQILKNKLLDRM